MVEDLRGKVFGKLTVVERAETKISPSGCRRTMWKCRCECGNTVNVWAYNLKRGTTQSCGCLQREKLAEARRESKGKHFEDLSGQRFGRLTVIKRDIEYKDSGGAARYKYKCLCDCGNYTYANPRQLKEGRVQSCGCLHKESAAKQGRHNLRHGGIRRNVPYKATRLYHIWTGMKQRCENIQNHSYPNYGGRGIRVCDEWNDFALFQEWALNNGYADNLSIDRIDVNGNYEPSNCRWATKLEQANNTRTNNCVDIDGVSHTVAEWSRISGVKSATIANRLRLGWEPKMAVYKS